MWWNGVCRGVSVSGIVCVLIMLFMEVFRVPEVLCVLQKSVCVGDAVYVSVSCAVSFGCAGNGV